jgi:sodium transport system permease protein
MRLEIVRQVFLKELRETLRDRRSMITMFGIPLLLYPLMTMSMAGMQHSVLRKLEQQSVTIAVVRPEAAPHLMEEIKKPKSGFKVLSDEDPRAALAAGKVDAVVTIPPRFEEGALALREERIKIELDRSRTSASFTESKLERLLNDYQHWIIVRRLASRGVGADVVKPVRFDTADVSTGGQRFGKFLSVLLPMMLLVTGILGSFFPAVNAATAERELGTLETLLVTPASKLELLLGKVGLVVISGLLTSGLNMLSMSLVLWRTFSMMGKGAAALTLDPQALLLSYLAAVPTLIFFAAAALVVALFARNYREANSYVTPVMLVSMAPMFVSIAEPKASLGLLVTPVINTSIVIRDVLTGQANAGSFLLAFFASCLYAVLMLSLAARIFSSEALVNPAWEPLSLKGFRRGGRVRPPRFPAMDEALALFVVCLLLQFYVAPEWLRHGLLPTLAGTEVLLIAAPALLAARLFRYPWRETFAFRPPAPAAMVGAALLGVGAVPWVVALVGLQNRVWPANSDMQRAMEKLFLPALQQNPVVMVIAVGLLAGVCEEILFRGPIQTAFARRLPGWAALLISSVLFAAAHMDPQGMTFRTLLGLLLGWIVLRGGSVYPAMLAHALIDSTNLALNVWGPKGSFWDLEHLVRLSGPWALQLAAGAALLAVGTVLCAQAFRHSGTRPGDRVAKEDNLAIKEPA